MTQMPADPSQSPAKLQLDVIIIGAGPAGLTAATYLARYRRQVAVLDAGQSRARWIPTSHNCPGFPFGLEGDQLLERYRQQAQKYGVTPTLAHVAKLEKQGDTFTATAHDGQSWQAPIVILATGVVDRMPAMQDLVEAIDRQAVRLCAVCDGYEASDTDIAVYAPINEAIRHALFMRTYSQRVTAVPTDDKAPDAELARQAAEAGIRVAAPARAMALVDGGAQVTGTDDQSHRYDTLYPVLGSDAQSALALSLGAAHDDNDELDVDDRMQTTVDGLYAIGDVVSALNQISVAVGHAAIAATAAHNRLPPNLRMSESA